MPIRPVLLAGILLLPGAAALADDLAPGLWEISLEAHVEAVPGFAPGPTTMTQCLSKADAHDPSTLLASVTSAGTGDCSYTERSYVANHFRFRMQCTGTLQLRSAGDVSLSPTRVEGTVSTSATIDGVPVELKSELHGHRIGDC